MPIVCPHCDREMDLIFYPKVPIGLYWGREKGEAVVSENTDVCCLSCYWQGRLIDLRSNEEVGIVQTAKNRAKAVLG